MTYNANHTQPMLDHYLQSALSNGWRFGNKTGVELNLGGNIPPPPPEYELHSRGSTSTTPDSKSNEKLSSLSSLSRSHQDLSKLDDDFSSAFKNNLHLNTHRYPLSLHNLISEASPNAQQNMIEFLRADNTHLRNELESLSRKISKLQRFEIELQKVHQAHEDLMKSSEKKEKLERAIRYKLEIETKSLKEENKSLKEHLNVALNTIAKRNPESFVDDNEFRGEIQKRDVLVAQLLSQNKELMSEKERQEIELQAQRLTLEEQRNHIEVLDNALMNAQNNVVKLEAELRKKNAFEERANHLQKALGNLQLASERRSQMEKRVRNHLEKEIESLTAKCTHCKKQLNGSVQISDEKKEVESLKKALVDYEEKIITLENEVAKWESKYFEESTMRHIEVNAASVPKDAKIAALEQTSQQSEKMIQEVRNERLKQMDELHGAHKKVAQLESKIRDLESKLAEKDAMIKVLQQHSREKDVVLQKSLLAQRSTTGRHARSASSMGLTTFSAVSNSVSSRGTPTSVCEVKESTLRKDSSELYSTGMTNKALSLSSSSSPTSFLKESNTSPGGLLDHSKKCLTNSSTSTSSNNSSVTTTSNNISTCNSSSLTLNSGSISLEKSNSSVNNQTTISNNLDEQLKELDKRLCSKDSIIRALRSEKERYPNHFWRV